MAKNFRNRDAKRITEEHRKLLDELQRAADLYARQFNTVLRASNNMVAAKVLRYCRRFQLMKSTVTREAFVSSYYERLAMKQLLISWTKAYLKFQPSMALAPIQRPK